MGRLLQSFQGRFGDKSGRAAWLDFRAADDPEAPTTVRGRNFPYRASPKKVAPGSVALPDAGSLTPAKVVTSASGSAAGDAGRVAAAASLGTRHRAAGVAPNRTGAAARGLLAFPRSASNALLVSARESASGRALAVFGPQVAYFAPEILMEQDVHAPTLEATGATFPGVNLYVQLGHGRDYAWSATSASQDIVDTFAVDLCEPGGAAPTKTSKHYLFRGRVPADGDAHTHQQLVPERRRPDLARHRDAARSSARRWGSSSGARRIARQARGLHAAALDLLPRGGLGAGLLRLQRPGRRSGARDFQRAASRSATRSTGSTSTTSTSRTSTRATTPCARPTRTRRCPTARASSGQASTPRPGRRRIRPSRRIRRRSTRNS